MIKKDDKNVVKDQSGFAEKFLKKMYKNYGNTIYGQVLIAFIWLLIAPFVIVAIVLISLDLFYAPYKLTQEIFFIVNDYDLEKLESYNKNTKYNLDYFRGWQYWIDLITSGSSIFNIFLFLFILFTLDNRKELVRLLGITITYISDVYKYIYDNKNCPSFEKFSSEFEYIVMDIRIAKRNTKRRPRLLLRGIYCITFGFCYIFLIKLIPIPRLELVDIISKILEWLG